MVPITIVTGANLNQQTSLGGLTLYEIILDSTIYRWSVPLKPLFTSGKISPLYNISINDDTLW